MPIRTDLPGPKAHALIAQGHYDLQSVYRACIIDDVASSGTTLVDVDGNRFLDLFASFALGALGYNHPALAEVARSEAFARASINPTSTPFLTTDAWVRFVKGLETRWGPRGMEHVFCVDSGSEGVESAIKLAFMGHAAKRRTAQGLPADPLQMPANWQAEAMANAGTDAVIVSFDGAFHGRSMGALSATHSKLTHKADIPAFAWPTVPFPTNLWPLAQYKEQNAAAEAASLAELARVLDAFAGRVAGVIVEPIQSEGGDRHASAAFFREVQRLAKAAGAAFILDEVQTGVAISGTLWCHEQFELPEPPDLVSFGKKMQMGGCFSRGAYSVQQFGRMYQTRNGDRARAMLAEATLTTIETAKLLENVRSVGRKFLHGLEYLATEHPKLVTQPRGRGFLLAFDLPTPAERDVFLKRALGEGVFASYTGTRSVRLRPHLITTHEEVDQALIAFDAALADMR